MSEQQIGYRPGEWHPARTWVFAVGVIGDEWNHVARRDRVLVETLVRRGVPAEHVAHLVDGDATVERIERTLAKFLPAAAPGDLLVVYFTGHGARDDANNGSFCVAGGEAWAHAAVFAAIERSFAGAGALLLADCCYSGGLAIEAPHRAGRVAYAALTSSLSTTESTGTWSFTDCLIEAFEGTSRVDLDADGYVTLAEVARHVERHMAVMEQQLSSFVVTNDFDPGLRLARGTQRSHPHVGALVSAPDASGTYYDGQVVEVRGAHYRVRFAGYDSDEDAWVTADALRPWQPVCYAPGARVEAQDGDDWYPAVVLAARRGMHLVSYEGYGPEHDDWVPRDRIRAPQSPAPPRQRRGPSAR